MFIVDYICKYNNLQIIKKITLKMLNFLSPFEQKWVNRTYNDLTHYLFST